MVNYFLYRIEEQNQLLKKYQTKQEERQRKLYTNFIQLVDEDLKSEY